MGTVTAKLDVPYGASAAEAIWYDPRRWSMLLDGFGRLESAAEDWPHEGARAVWASKPGGRGRVIEVVTAYEPRARCVTRVEDDTIHGTQTIVFSPHEGGTLIDLKLIYTIKNRNIFTPIMDSLFVKGAQRMSLHRTLGRLEIELRGDQNLPV
ncbi:hypothetical protein DSM112329_01547 [Paraconexibacter sp. AEG42_29]|uniref:SRPBCC family protein n=1 Tax=Paraconexibacter sp. AEG42_29 TaxID=2997339 RepID=A0AAU7ASN4_9ACTN